MLTTRYIKDNLKIFMNRKCNNSFVILCVRVDNEKDKTAMLANWEAALDLILDWTGLALTRANFEEDEYEYKMLPAITPVEYAEPEATPSLFRDGYDR